MADIWPITFDAKKCAFRQSKDGIVLSLVVHPNSDCIAVLAAAEIGFDFQVTVCPMLESPAGEPQERRQASQAPAGVAKTEGERAVQRAGILARDDRFQRWVWERTGRRCDVGRAAEFIRQRCKVASRAELAAPGIGGALEAFRELEAAFRAWAQDNPL